ncbi:tyrosinase central domain-containing protein [Favolaschia claudopus]|uniref:Tyrosinase central domain-containing protein n=1 Tax=Favolaschia claudopus TaxID=2862362 RepID=A0AAW0C992_9AGAR
MSPQLPLELERQIFETAAQKPSEIVKLFLVARRNANRYHTLLYRVVRFGDPRKTLRIASRLNSASPAPWSAVRHLCADWMLEMPRFRDLLSRCTKITHLYLSTFNVDSSLLPILDNIRVQSLAVNLRRLFMERSQDPDDELDDYDEDQASWDSTPVDLEHPLFSSVTHLHSFDYIDSENVSAKGIEWVLKLSTLPALTHLAFSNPPHPDILETILNTCPRLRVLILSFDAGTLYMDILDIEDPRLVVIPDREDEKDWELGAYGGDDFWIKAEEFVENKKRGDADGAFLRFSPLYSTNSFPWSKAI